MGAFKEMEIELADLQAKHDTAFGILQEAAYGPGLYDPDIVEIAQKEMDRLWPMIRGLERRMGITQQRWTGD